MLSNIPAGFVVFVDVFHLKSFAGNLVGVEQYTFFIIKSGGQVQRRVRRF